MVTLTQTFETGPAHGLLYSAKYQFPLPENAAVCAFEMRFQNGKVTRLATKERNKAEDAYFKASHAGRAVGLTGRCSDNSELSSIIESSCKLNSCISILDSFAQPSRRPNYHHKVDSQSSLMLRALITSGS